MLSSCIGTAPTPTNPSGTGAATPGSVAQGAQTLLTVATTPGTNPASTGLTVTADLTSIGGSAAASFHDDGLAGDATAGDGTYSFQATVAAATTPGATSLPFTVADAQSRSGTGTIALTVTAAGGGGTPSLTGLVVSQVYGGGGNSGSTLTNDYIELFNPTRHRSIPVTGRASSTPPRPAPAWQSTNALRHVQPAATTSSARRRAPGGTTPLPTPGRAGTIAMAAAPGKVALVSSTTALTRRAARRRPSSTSSASAPARTASRAPARPATISAVERRPSALDARLHRHEQQRRRLHRRGRRAAQQRDRRALLRRRPDEPAVTIDCTHAPDDDRRDRRLERRSPRPTRTAASPTSHVVSVTPTRRRGRSRGRPSRPAACDRAAPRPRRSPPTRRCRPGRTPSRSRPRTTTRRRRPRPARCTVTVSGILTIGAVQGSVPDTANGATFAVAVHRPDGDRAAASSPR